MVTQGEELATNDIRFFPVYKMLIKETELLLQFNKTQFGYLHLSATGILKLTLVVVSNSYLPRVRACQLQKFCFSVAVSNFCPRFCQKFCSSAIHAI